MVGRLAARSAALECGGLPPLLRRRALLGQEWRFCFSIDLGETAQKAAASCRTPRRGWRRAGTIRKAHAMKSPPRPYVSLLQDHQR
jgi:hypothetical protein